MIRRSGLALVLTSLLSAPVLAQPPAPPAPSTPGPAVQAPDAQGSNPQGFRARRFGRRNRDDFSGVGEPIGGGRRGFGRFSAQGDPSGGAPGQGPVPGDAALPTPPLALQGRAPAPRPAGPPPSPTDALVMRSLQGSISAVFDPGAKSARIKLIETDDHGVEGLRTLKPGDLYRDGWRLRAVTATEATLRKGKSLLHVDITRGWPAPTPIQPAVLVQPPIPGSPPASQTGRRGPGPGPAATSGLGLSNARVGGSPRAPDVQGFQPPARPSIVRNNPDGSRTVTSGVNGRTVVVTLPAGR